MNKDFKIVTRPEGFRQCEPMPSSEDLDRFYEEKYFQANDIYAREYDDQEIAFFRDAVRRKVALLRSTVDHELAGARALEVGVGEGWTLQVLDELGLEVTGVDYSDYACRQHNPAMCEHLICGKPEDVLRSMQGDGEFEVIWLDNVLEHSPDPSGLLELLSKLSSARTRLVVEVPNDYSRLQLHLLGRQKISQAFWEAVPEHLSYFQPDSLAAFCLSHGWRSRRIMSDFPIDLYLLNDYSNYIERPETGKAAHRARLTFEEAFRDTPVESMIHFLESAAAIGLGRNLIGVFEPV
jgi:2-polyprenyl-3-methyl-5-hydroxy-6-metoxy-1,4-benzoquinol methylase